MIPDVCPSSWKLSIAPPSVSISLRGAVEYRVLERSETVREGSVLTLSYELPFNEVDAFVAAFNASLGSYLSGELPPGLVGVIGLDKAGWHFEPFWRFANKELEIRSSAEDGSVSFDLELVNVKG